MNGSMLDGKVVIVTGGGAGLGRVMALGLATRGARVAIMDINVDRATAVAAEIEAASGGGTALAIGGSIAIEADSANAVTQTREALGGLHVLVNNAALGMRLVSENFVTDPPRFWDCPPDLFRAFMETNVGGPFLMARAVARHMMDQGWGRIVNVTTSLDSMMRGGNMPYGQAKAAVEGASASWAEDLAGTGVTVNVLIPGGAADTAMIPDHAPFERSALNPPSVMVAPVCWLASDASDGVTGKRFIGRDWDPALPEAEAADAAGAPAAWAALKRNPPSALP